MKSVPTHSTRTAPAKILVLGATGGTSRSIVTQALARGNEVTLLARSPEKAGNLKGVRRSSPATPATNRACVRAIRSAGKPSAVNPVDLRSAHRQHRHHTKLPSPYGRESDISNEERCDLSNGDLQLLLA